MERPRFVAGRGQQSLSWIKAIENPRNAAAEHGVELSVVKLPEAKRGCVLLPRRWVVKRSFAWTLRFGALVKDYQRCAATVADLQL